MCFSNLNNFRLPKIIQKTIKNNLQTMKKSSLKTTCFSTSLFSRFWLHFGCFWEALGPLLGSFGLPKWSPRALVTLRVAYFILTFFVFAAALSISIDLGRFGDDFGRVLGRFGLVLGWFGEGFGVDLMLSFSFSWLHFPCSCHFLGHSIWPGGLREAIK